MVEIELTRGKVALIDDEDEELVSQYSWQAYLAKGGRIWYADTAWREDGTRRRTSMHRLIMGLEPGNPLTVDHIDHNGLHNWHDNLRLATRAQQQYNTRPRGGTSKYKGVSWSRQRQAWLASIKLDGSTIIIGYYDTEWEAALAYNVKAFELFGEYANLNVENTPQLEWCIS